MPEMVPIDDTPPAELDPLGVAHGHDIDVPRELSPLLPGLLPGRPPALDADNATAAGALAFLQGQLGLAEYPAGSNSNWITDWYYGWNAPWCAMTVSRALIEGGFGGPERIDVPGVDTTTAKGWAYCPYLEADFRAAGRWHGAYGAEPNTTPEPGDLVLFDWDGDGWADHIGMLAERYDDGTLAVYEGNTDEGVLRLKHRSLTYVRGFARPPYAAVVPPAPAPTNPKEPEVSKVAYPLEVHSGETRRLPVLAIGGGFEWQRASVTFAADSVHVRRAIVGPDERDIEGLAPERVGTGRMFTGRGYVDLRPGDEWLSIELATSPVGTLDLYVEAED